MVPKDKKWIRKGKFCILLFLLCSALYLFLSVEERGEKVLYQGRAGEQSEAADAMEKGTDAMEKGTDAMEKGTDTMGKETDAMEKETDAMEKETEPAAENSSHAIQDAEDETENSTVKEQVKELVSEKKSGKININTANSEELQSLKGIGPSTASSIIAYREEYGGFSSIEEIMNVKRIGEKTFAKIKDRISVD